jgi:hypothetical protein
MQRKLIAIILLVVSLGVGTSIYMARAVTHPFWGGAQSNSQCTSYNTTAVSAGLGIGVTPATTGQLVITATVNAEFWGNSTWAKYAIYDNFGSGVPSCNSSAGGTQQGPIMTITANIVPGSANQFQSVAISIGVAITCCGTTQNFYVAYWTSGGGGGIHGGSITAVEQATD